MRKYGLLIVVLCCAPLPAWADEDPKAVFQSLDSNRDGVVSEGEVDPGKQRLFERLLRQGDSNKDGKLSLEEFSAATKVVPQQDVPESEGRDRPANGRPDPRQLFTRFDQNKDGKLTKDELPEQMRENFARLDTDGDGQIIPEELGRGLGAQARQRPEGTPAPRPDSEPRRPDVRGIEAFFDARDNNKDGKLTLDEVPDERRPMFEALIARFADDGDKGLTREQLVRGLAAQPRRDQPIRPTDRRPEGRPQGPPADGRGTLNASGPLFASLDSDGDGKLSEEEIANASAALRKLDRDGDGTITRQELVPRPQ